MKSAQSVGPPSAEDLVLVVVPDDSNEYGKRNFFWVLQNVATNGQKLCVVCSHCNKHISHEKVDKDLDEYVSICNQLEVSCDTRVIPCEDEDDAADKLKKLICDSGITKFVMPGAADKRYSEKMKSPESKLAKTLMETAPSTCKIWLTCKGHLICTREANTSVHDIRPQPVDSSALQIVKEIKDDNLLEQAKWLKDNDQHFLYRVNCYIEEKLKWCAYHIKCLEEKIASHTKAEGTSRPQRKECFIKDLEEEKENEKRCQLSLDDFNRYKLTIENRITNMAYLIEYLEEGARPGGHEGSSMCRKLEPSITNTALTSKRLVQLIKRTEGQVKARQRKLNVAYEDKLSQEKFLLKIALLERSMNKEEPGEAERIKIQKEKEFKETLSILDGCNMSIFRAEKEIAGMRDLIKFLKGIGRTMHILNHTDLDADICDVQLRKEAHQRPIRHREAEPHITSVLKTLERMKNDYQRWLHEVISEKSDLETKLNNLKKEHAKSPKRINEQEKKKKRYQYYLNYAKIQKSHLENRIVVVEYLEEIARSGYFLQEPQAAVTESGGLGEEKNDQQSALTLPAEIAVNTEFSKDDIEESKNSLEGEGGSGSGIYKGVLHNTTFVFIKMLDPESVQGESDFIRKAAELGRVRHPSLVTLMGVRKEVFGLVYEFLPNGSLEDQIVACRDGSMPPLTWQVRMKIIREIWTVLTFLHSSKPPLVHGNLKASKALLDANFTCKLEASGIFFQSDGTPTATGHDDLHSFGTIALQLLMTGTWLSPENDAVKVVKEAKEKGELDTVLKTTAWDWPPELAKRLANIGLRCVGMMSGLESPAEAPDDLAVAEEVRQLFDAADRLAAVSQEEEADAKAPRQFFCRLSLRMFVEPVVGPDGHTYELERIKTFFSLGNKRSPVTRQTLPDQKLIPNLAMKSMIVDWKEKQQKQVRMRISTVCDQNAVRNSQPTIPPAAQSQPTGLHPDPVSTPLHTSAEAQLLLQPPPASSSPTAHAGSTAPLNTSAAARSHRLQNPLPPPPPPRPVSPTLLPHTGLRRRYVNGRLPSSSTEPDVPAGPGETSIIRGKFKHQ